MRVAVVVLGDIAQSPRMACHALALAARDIDVDLICQTLGTVPAEIAEHPRITLHSLGSRQFAARHRLPRPVFIVYALARAGVTAFALFRLLAWRRPAPDLILVQNPPAIPTLWIALIAARLRAARLAVDWHNYGFTMLAYRLGSEHPLVRLARRYEGVCGRAADLAFCVSRAMRADLAQRWAVHDAVVLYDQPARKFLAARATRQEATRGARLALLLGLPAGDAPDPTTTSILVSPTSWTADEDFALLLAALQRYDATQRARPGVDGEPPRHLLVVITGKGPLRAQFEAQLAAAPLASVTVLTRWLSATDYVELLALADLGLSLHRSSSGLDLPMKILDLFGAGVPVCAYDYGACLRELVDPDQTGCLFRTDAELGELLVSLCGGAAPSRAALTRMRETVLARHTRTWEDEWGAVAAPVLLGRTQTPDPAG